MTARKPRNTNNAPEAPQAKYTQEGILSELLASAQGTKQAQGAESQSWQHGCEYVATLCGNFHKISFNSTKTEDAIKKVASDIGATPSQVVAVVDFRKAMDETFKAAGLTADQAWQGIKRWHPAYDKSKPLHPEAIKRQADEKAKAEERAGKATTASKDADDKPAVSVDALVAQSVSNARIVVMQVVQGLFQLINARGVAGLDNTTIMEAMADLQNAHAALVRSK